MKNQINKIKTIIIITFLVCTSVTLVQAQSSDFSGTWKRNNDKSDPGDLSINSIPSSVEIKQDVQSIGITRNFGQGVNLTYTEIIKFDGSDTETLTPSKLKRSARIQWSYDKKELTENFTSKTQEGDTRQSGKQILTLLDNEKCLKIVITQITDGRAVQMEEIFDKQ